MDATILDKYRANYGIIEFYLWTAISLAVGGRIIFFSIYSSSDFTKTLMEFYSDAILAFLIFIFPIFFKLIFGLLPLELIRKSREIKSKFTLRKADALPPTNNFKTLRNEKINELDAPTNETGNNLILQYAENSRSLAQGIYVRSGVYLLVGVLVAFSGLAFFYTQTGGILIPTDPSSLLLSLAPKFGMLFFIEFVAFFFLRQYRSAMDEFRYYESVARKREEVSALIKLTSDSESKIEIMDLIRNDSFFSKANTLSKNETTEIIEARKLEKGEIDLLEKVVDTLAKAKR